MRRSKFALVLPLAFAGVAVPVSSAHAVPPDNDLFANAKAITLDFAEQVDTTMATVNEDADLQGQAACNSPDPVATVWYTLEVDSTQWVILSSAPPTYSSGFNVLVDTGEGFECVTGGPVEVWWIAEPGVTYIIQSIDDQQDGDGVAGGTLNFSATSGGAPGVELCPGIIDNDPGIPEGFNIIIGTEGHDHLRGTPGNDLIIGRAGDDVIKGRGGDDILIGCDGHDKIRGNAGDDVLFGDSFDFFGNPMSTSGGNDDMRGGKGNDEMLGGPGDDHMHGGSGDDRVIGNQGDDDLSGNRGNDFVAGGFGNDHAHGNAGDDFVSGGWGDDELDGGGGDDFITGDLPNGQEDPNPNHDHCRGGRGTNEIVFCEDGKHDHDGDHDDHGGH